MLFVKNTILQLLLTFLFWACKVQCQGFLDFPTGTSINTPTPTVINDETVVFLGMNGATPTRANQTICTGFNLQPTDLFFIMQFSGTVSSSAVHHMALYGCSIAPTANPCRCPMEKRSPLYSWARHTPSVRFTGTGKYTFGVFRIGQGTDKTFLFLETHYHHALTTADSTSGITIHITRNLNLEPPIGSYYELAIYSIMGIGTIPAEKNSYSIDTCINTDHLPADFSAEPIIFAIQPHTHNMGRVINTFLDSIQTPSNDSFELGLGNPLWPNAYVMFNPVLKANNVNFYLFNRCVYSSAGVSDSTNTNGKFQTKTPWIEMCVQSLLVAKKNYFGPWKSTTPAFLTGTCNSTQSAGLDTIVPSSFPVTNPILDLDALYGNQTGSYTYTSKGKRHTINLDMETYTSIFY